MRAAIHYTSRTILAIFLLAGLPFIAVSARTHMQPADQYLRLTVTPQAAPSVAGDIDNPAKVMTNANTAQAPQFNSALSPLNLSQLAGDDKFKVGDAAYVHAAVSGGQIGYVFGINRTPVSDESGSHTVTIRGIVTETTDQTVRLSYEFDMPLAQTLPGNTDAPITINLRVSQTGAARFVNVEGVTG